MALQNHLRSLLLVEILFLIYFNVLIREFNNLQKSDFDKIKESKVLILRIYLYSLNTLFLYPKCG